jgi:hypothetical protein
MIRPTEYITETCSQCKRPDWTRQVIRTLYTAEECGSGKIKVKGLKKNFEPMIAGCGGNIYTAVKEAVEYCQTYKVPGVGFEFNGKTVLVTSDSDEAAVVKKWWKAVYNETPEESFAKR